MTEYLEAFCRACGNEIQVRNFHGSVGIRCNDGHEPVPFCSKELAKPEDFVSPND